MRCLTCERPFTAHSERQLFCHVNCRVAHHRKEQGACFYCGEPGRSRDHFTPHAVSTIAKRRTFRGVEWVPACTQCNAWARDLMGADARFAEIRAKLVAKLAALKPVEWTAHEIEELGPNLRRAVRAKVRAQESLRTRILFLDLRLIEIQAAENETAPVEET